MKNIELSSPAAMSAAGRAAEITAILAASITPSVVGVGDLPNVSVRQLAPGPVNHHAELARIDEQHMSTPIAQIFLTRPAIGFVTCQKPQAGGDLSRVEELPR